MAKDKLPFIGEQDGLSGTYVFLRSSLNVPVKDGEVVNQFRLMRGLATIQYLINQGARVILAGHISNSKETEQQESLEPIFSLLQAHIPVIFSDEVATPKTTLIRDSLKDGEVLLIENLRRDPREKKNDADFARSLADLADIYVNDAFAVSHREHASLVGIPKFLPSFVGHNFKHEYEELIKMMQPKAPALFILGGAKFDTKMPLIEKYLSVYDHVLVAGALANDLYKAKGYEVGQSLLSGVDVANLKPILEHKKTLIPVDVTVMSSEGVRVTTPEAVEPHETIMDAGPETITMLTPYIEKAKTVLWNGPLGNYEKSFDRQTVELAKVIAKSKAYSLIGGGDTIAAIEHLNCQEQYGFLSTAGGAMLSFLEHGTLPALEALKGE